MDRMNSHTPLPGFPTANSPKRSIHASIAMSITFLIPNRRRKNGIKSMHSVSDIWLREMSILACCTPNVLAYSGNAPKLLMNGLAYPLVICNIIPNNMEKMKNTAIRYSLNREKAFSPNASMMLFFPVLAAIEHAGRVNEYAAKISPIPPLTMNCSEVGWNPNRSTAHMEHINPIVPKMRIGGNAFTVSNPALSNALYATELESANVGM